MRDASYWIAKLGLTAHPEGGFYRQTYQADLTVVHSSLPHRFKGDRSASTAIYFLLQGGDFSAFHRISSDEIWHFYVGNALEVHVIEQDGRHTAILLGPDADQGELRRYKEAVQGDQQQGQPEL